MNRRAQKSVATVSIGLGIGLLAWILYDATAVMTALGLARWTSEAGVVVAGLAVAIATIGFGVARYRRASRHSPAAV